MTRQEIDRLIDREGLPGAAKQRRVAAIIFTYRCTIRCRHCLFGCADNQADVVMTPRQCADGLAMLHDTGRVVHIAGGEAMLYWNRLAESVRLAHAEGCAPHFIETNCSFAVSDEIVRDRFTFLRAHGVKGILASADPFHQEFVPAERFIRVRRLTADIFGPRNFYGSTADAAEIQALGRVTRDERVLREYVRKHPPVMVGTAWRKLSPYLDQYGVSSPDLPLRHWQAYLHGPACRAEFATETIWELHIDPYGNIQTNCGMILGNVSAVTPAQLLAAGPEKANRFVKTVSESGALGLAELTRNEYGFEIPRQVTQNCDLCYRTRRFLRTHHPEIFGPAEVYS